MKRDVTLKICPDWKINRNVNNCLDQEKHSGHCRTMFQVKIRDRPIWLFWGRYWYNGHSWTDSQYF